nr:DNA-processing protein DprA [Roseomonas marmotae]
MRLTRTEGIGPLTWRRLLAQYDSASAALDALPRHAARRAAPFTPFPQGEAERELDRLEGMGGRFLVWGEADYPPLLALLEDAPPMLAAIGDIGCLHARQVAVVGARNASALGRRVAEGLAEALAAEGIVITSGLARGIDGAAHQGALRRGRSVGVVPGGIDIAYPLEHAELQSNLAEGGALVAEAPLGTAPIARHFPRRNRIIAGLSLGVVVVEAAWRSGTLMTARLALEAGREVFAVPGSPLDPRCAGSNELIRQGAHLTGRAEDVLEHLPESPREAPLFRLKPAAPAQKPPAQLPVTEGDAAHLLDLIGNSPVAVDELLRRCHLSTAAVQGLLLDLELEGRIETLAGNRVVRSD